MDDHPAQTVTINGQDYDLAQLSDQARQQVFNIRFADQEIERLKSKIAVAQTARQAYVAALTAELPQN